MKKFTIIAALIIAAAFVGSAFAAMPGKTIEYAGGPMGKVTFDGSIHAKAGNKCPDCHGQGKPFGPMAPHKERMKAPMKDGKHVAGEFCGTCHNGKEHNGKVIFAQDAANCAKCHKK